MSKAFIDLRSDTVTKPTAEMLSAMSVAEIGDDVMREDVSVQRLEAEVAALLGKEAALFVTSGTMANQIAIHLHCRSGESVITEEDSHCFIYEAGGAAALSGVQFDLVKVEDWSQSNQWTKKIRDEEIHAATTRLLVLENTHNATSGRVWQPELLKRVLGQAKERRLKTHCDGARLWNAAVRLGVSEKTLCEGFDSVAVCFSKGLGAPVGSAVVGTKDFIEQARKVRKRWGGGMRQVGYLAEAARYALEHHRERLQDDHLRTQKLCAGLRSLKVKGRGVEFLYPEPETNMIYFRVPEADGNRLNEAFAKGGVKMFFLRNQWHRAVVHLGVDDADISRALQVIGDVVKG